MNLTRREYEAIMAIAELALAADTADTLWPMVAQQLLGPLLQSDVVAVADIQAGGQQGRFGLIEPQWAQLAVPAGSAMHVDLLDGHPLTHHMFSPAAMQVVRVSDLVAPLRWRHMPGHAKMQELIGATHQIGMTVRTSASSTLAVSAIRSGTDFTARDVELGRRLQHLLRLADRHLAAVERIIAPLPSAARAAAEANRLTHRELVVLGLLAEGRSAQQVASALGVSVRTIGKHQEHVYRKLGVDNRVSALARARTLGLLTEPAPVGAVGG